MATRKYNNKITQMKDPGQHIIDADCVFEDGGFVMKSLPANLPKLFTLRFTAPEDFTQGNVVVVNDKDLPVRTPGMVNASTGLFKAGTVMHCDIDMDRELAFFWQNGGPMGGVMPNLSFDEQFAGFYDENGDKVYVRSVRLGNLPAQGQTKQVPHGIANIKSLVAESIRQDYTAEGDSIGRCGSFSYGSICFAFDLRRSYVQIAALGVSWTKFTAIGTYYYTCTDR